MGAAIQSCVSGTDCWGIVEDPVGALRRERDSLVQQLDTERQRAHQAELERDAELERTLQQEELKHANQEELARARAAVVQLRFDSNKMMYETGGEDAKAAFRVVGDGGFRSRMNSYIIPSSSPVMPIRADSYPGYGAEGDKARTRRLRAELNSHRRDDYAIPKREATMPWVVCQ